MLVSMCPDTVLYVSSCYDICVLTLLTGAVFEPVTIARRASEYTYNTTVEWWKVLLLRMLTSADVCWRMLTYAGVC
jgi:hypothetical protein